MVAFTSCPYSLHFWPDRYQQLLVIRLLLILETMNYIFLFSQGMIIKPRKLVQGFFMFGSWCSHLSLPISALFFVSAPFKTKAVTDKQERNSIFEEFCHLKLASLYCLIVKYKLSAVSLQVLISASAEVKLTLSGC